MARSEARCPDDEAIEESFAARARIWEKRPSRCRDFWESG